MVLSAGCIPVLYAAAQDLSAPRDRVFAAAMLVLISNLAGSGLGPTLVGFLSDRLRPTLGDGGLRLALSCAVAFMAVAGCACLLAAKTLVRDLHTESSDSRLIYEETSE
jgi:MFS family permease